MGRISVDVYPLQTGVSLREVESFGKYLGGSATNVAVAAARYGRRSAVITRTGADPFGEFLHDALRGFGVDDRYVTPVDGPPHAAGVLRDLPARRLPAVLLPRAEGAGPRDPHRRARPRRDPRRRSVFWATGHRALAGAEPLGDARRAGGARPPGHHGARPRLPPDVLGVARGGPRAVRARRSRTPTVAVGNLDEWETAVGSARPAHGGVDRGLDLAVVKQGPRGRARAPRRRVGRGAARAGRGRQRARRRRRVRRRAVPRAARGLGPRAADALLQRGGRARRRRGSPARTRCRPVRGRDCSRRPSMRGALEITPESAGWRYCGSSSSPRASRTPSTRGERRADRAAARGRAATVTFDGAALRAGGPRRRVLRASPTSSTCRAMRAWRSRPGRRALRAARRARRRGAWSRGTSPPPTSRRAARRRPGEPPGQQLLLARGVRGRRADRRRGAHARRQLVARIRRTSTTRTYPGVETALEEIYYFEVAGGGFAYQRVVRAGRRHAAGGPHRRPRRSCRAATTARRWPRPATTSTTST